MKRSIYTAPIALVVEGEARAVRGLGPVLALPRLQTWQRPDDYRSLDLLGEALDRGSDSAVFLIRLRPARGARGGFGGEDAGYLLAGVHDGWADETRCLDW